MFEELKEKTKLLYAELEGYVIYHNLTIKAGAGCWGVSRIW